MIVEKTKGFARKGDHRQAQKTPDGEDNSAQGIAVCLKKGGGWWHKHGTDAARRPFCARFSTDRARKGQRRTQKRRKDALQKRIARKRQRLLCAKGTPNARSKILARGRPAREALHRMAFRENHVRARGHAVCAWGSVFYSK